MTDFVMRFGAIYEHSPWVAEQAEALLQADSDDIAQVRHVMMDCVDNASQQHQLQLIRAHPDLAGKAQVAAELTPESSTEQARAGLHLCNEHEYAEFQRLNSAYKAKFGFPFIMAVRNSSRSEILNAFAARIDNDYDEEFETALQQIHAIAAMRLAAIEEAS